MKTLTIHSKGKGAFLNITGDVEEEVRRSGVTEGAVCVFAKHTTVAVMIADDEEGLKRDLIEVLDRLLPEQALYLHNSPGDENAHAHLRSMIHGCSAMIPIRDGQLDLGRWQRIFFVDFDPKPQQREMTVTVLPAA